MKKWIFIKNNFELRTTYQENVPRSLFSLWIGCGSHEVGDILPHNIACRNHFGHLRRPTHSAFLHSLASRDMKLERSW